MAETSKDDIGTFTGIRGLASLAVVAIHSQVFFFAIFPGAWPERRFLWTGNYAVDTFFILSGFVITLNYGDRMRRPNFQMWKTFILLRLARMWPVHVMTILLYAIWFKTIDIHPKPYFPNMLVVPHEAAMGMLFAPWNVIMNVLMLNQVWPASSISTPAWSVSLEFLAYLVFPLIAFVVMKFRTPLVAFIGAGVVLLAGAYWLGVTSSDDFTYIGYQLPFIRIIYAFPAGCLLCVGWKQLSPRWKNGWGYDAAVIASIVTLFTIVAFIPQTTIIYMPAPAIPLLGVIILGCAGATGPVKWFLTRRPLQWLGHISYSLYQTHFIALMACELYFFTPFLLVGPPAVKLWVAIGMLASVIGLAWLSYTFIEEPCRKRARTWIFRNAPPKTLPADAVASEPEVPADDQPASPGRHRDVVDASR